FGGGGGGAAGFGGGGAGREGAGAAALGAPPPSELKSRSPNPPSSDLAAGLAAALPAGAFAAGAAAAVPGDASRMKPSLSSLVISVWKVESKFLPTFFATSPRFARPSIAESTARSPRSRKLVLPEASWTPLPDFE